jgi:hypothetical protein
LQQVSAGIGGFDQTGENRFILNAGFTYGGGNYARAVGGAGSKRI